MLLDLRGEVCPGPALKTLEALPRLAAGEALEVLTDHPPALQTIPAYTSPLGYRSRVEEIAPGAWKLTIEKVEGAPAPPAGVSGLPAKEVTTT